MKKGRTCCSPCTLASPTTGQHNTQGRIRPVKGAPPSAVCVVVNSGSICKKRLTHPGYRRDFSPAAAQSLVATGFSTNLDIAYYTIIPPVQTRHPCPRKIRDRGTEPAVLPSGCDFVYNPRPMTRNGYIFRRAFRDSLPILAGTAVYMLLIRLCRSQVARVGYLISTSPIGCLSFGLSRRNDRTC